MLFPVFLGFFRETFYFLINDLSTFYYFEINNGTTSEFFFTFSYFLFILFDPKIPKLIDQK